jgi:formamidopyrimidine-DNA glycosylase
VPELPEVETIRRQLAPVVEGRVLTRLDVLDPRWCLPLAPETIRDAVSGRRVEGLGRRGKYLVWHFEGDAHLLLHLRMTGTLLLASEFGSAPVPHTRVVFHLEGAQGRLVFVDPRRFGTGELALGGEALDAFLDARLGLEPLDPGFDADHLRALARGCRAPSRRSCSIRSGSRAWGTSTPTKRCTARRSILCGSRAS